MKKWLVMVLVLSCCFSLNAQISTNTLKKQELYKELSAKSTSEVLTHLQKYAKNQNNLWDINILTPLNILQTRPEAIPSMGEMILDSINYCRVSRLLITEVLGSIGNPAALPYLKKAIKLDDKVIADKAISALGEIRDSEDNELLEELKDADSKAEKAKILRAMMNVKYMDPRKKQMALYQELAKIVYNYDEDIELRAPAVACLGLFGRNDGIYDKVENNKFIMFCLDVVKNENENRRLRIACLESLERSRALTAIDELYDFMVSTNDLQFLFAVKDDLVMLCSKKADSKIEEFRELTNNKDWMEKKQQSITDFYNKPENQKLKEEFSRGYHALKSPRGLNDIKTMFDIVIPSMEKLQKSSRGSNIGRSMVE